MTQAGAVVASGVDLLRWGARVRRLNPALWLGVAGLAVIILAALLADWLAPKDPLATDVSHRLLGPGVAGLAGTDELGRDILSRTIFAARISLQVSAIAVAVGSVPGVLIGTVAAYAGGRLDGLLMRTMDLLFAFPAILLAIVIMAGLGTSIANAMIAIGIIFIPGFARLTRVLTQSVMKERFIDYSRSIGTPAHRIMSSEIFPNIWPPLLVQASTAMAYAVTIEAALSFLGLGAQPPTPSWGNMIDGGRGYLAVAPWMALVPGGALFVAVVSLNLLAEGLRQRLDPRFGRG